MPDPLKDRESPARDEWLQKFFTRRRAVTNWWDSEWKRHEENYKFFYGEHLDKEAIGRLKKAERTAVSLPEIPVNTLSVVGREVIGRWQTSFKGRSDADRPVAQAITEADRLISYMADSAQQDSDAFLDLFVCGIGWKQTYLDANKSLDGEIAEDQPYPWEMGVDPSATRKNLTDRRYVMRWKRVAEDELPILFPNSGLDFAAVKQTHSVSYAGKPQETADEQNINRTDGVSRLGVVWDVDREEVEVCEYEFLDLEPVYRWMELNPSNPVVGEDGLPLPVERSGTKAEFDAFQAQREANDLPPLERATRERDGYLVQRREVYKKAFLLGDRVLRKPRVMETGTWSFECMTGFPKKTPEGTRWFCPVDLGKDPQRWADRFAGILIDTYAVSPKQAIWTEEGVFKNEKDALAQIAKPGGLVKFKDGALRDKKVIPGQTPTFPTFPAQLFDMFKGMVSSSMGSSPYSTGQVGDVRRAAFGSIDLIQKAGQSVFATMFDSLKLYRKRCSILKIRLMAAFLDWETIARGIGEEHAPNLPRPEANGDWSNVLREVEKFDLAADEMPSASTQKQAVLDTLPQLIGVLKEAGMAMPPTILLGILETAQLLTSKETQDWIAAIQQAQDRPDADQVPISENERLQGQEAEQAAAQQAAEAQPS